MRACCAFDAGGQQSAQSRLRQPHTVVAAAVPGISSCCWLKLETVECVEWACIVTTSYCDIFCDQST